MSKKIIDELDRRTFKRASLQDKQEAIICRAEERMRKACDWVEEASIDELKAWIKGSKKDRADIEFNIRDNFTMSGLDKYITVMERARYDDLEVKVLQLTREILAMGGER